MLNALFFYLTCGVVLASAGMALLGTRDVRTSLAYFLASMFALVGVFLFVGAQVVAIAQLLFCLGLGLACFFALDAVDDPDDEGSRVSDPRSWSWITIVFGVAGTCLMASLLFEVAPRVASDGPAPSPKGDAFSAIGVEVIVRDGLALLGVGLVLVASAVGAGYLASRGQDS